jgi:hypothetical protein
VRREREELRQHLWRTEKELTGARQAMDRLQGRRGTALEMLLQGPPEGRTSEFLDKVARVLRGTP